MSCMLFLHFSHSIMLCYSCRVCRTTFLQQSSYQICAVSCPLWHFIQFIFSHNHTFNFLRNMTAAQHVDSPDNPAPAITHTLFFPFPQHANSRSAAHSFPSLPSYKSIMQFFVLPSALLFHSLCSKKEKPWPCPRCNNNFAFRDALK